MTTQPHTGIPESALWQTLALYQGWRYRTGDVARYPAQLPGDVGVALGPPHETDCSAFVEGLVLLAAQAAGVPLLWSPALHAIAMIDRSRCHTWWPTEAYVAAGLAVDVAPDAMARGDWPRWTIAQGWTRDPATHPPGPGATTYGHTMILVDCGYPDPDADEVDDDDAARCLVMHCGRLPGTPGRGGVGWRGIGPLEVGPPVLGPPAGWEGHPGVETWGRLRRLWPVMRGCALRVG